MLIGETFFCFTISARKSAPNDGTGKGEVQGYPNAYSHSKQNSDAAGFYYQGFRKDPFTFATSSLFNSVSDYGKYPVKIYNDKCELIYQLDSGGDNSDKTPIGGVIVKYRTANSMMETVKKTNLFYWDANGVIISQVGQSKDLFNYYWTSYSRGTDGSVFNSINYPFWHNTYLDGYIVLRSKSIYDPCPYGYRTSTNGTYNNFNSNAGWINYSYDGGMLFKDNWFHNLGRRSVQSFSEIGYFRGLRVAINVNETTAYVSLIYSTRVSFNHSNQSQAVGYSVRCIEDATVKADDSEASASQ